jgi:hypothetical protein
LLAVLLSPGYGSMKNHLSLRMILILAGMIIYGGGFHSAMAHSPGDNHGVVWSASAQQVVETPIPTDVSSAALVETPEARQLPPVGSNAGLVIGASVIVLIIIGGVLGTRRKLKH